MRRILWGLKGKVRELRLKTIELKNNIENQPRLSAVHCRTSDDVHKYIVSNLSTIVIFMIRDVTISRAPSKIVREIKIIPNGAHKTNSSMMSIQRPTLTTCWLNTIF